MPIVAVVLFFSLMAVPSSASSQVCSRSEDAYEFLLGWGSMGYGDAQFLIPMSIVVDSSGNIYVTEYLANRIQKFDSNGNFITKWGSRGSEDCEFRYPRGITVDLDGNVYVIDTAIHRIQKFTSLKTSHILSIIP